MRIDFDRISKLAGLPTNSNRSGGRLNEGASHDDADEGMYEMEDTEEGMEGMEEMDDADEGMYEMEDADEMAYEMEDADEVLDVDEAMLVQELRRAKRIMESKRRRPLRESREARKRRIFESQLKKVIDEEVANVMEEMNLTSDWIYGDNKPRRSKKGYSHQGNMLPGLGFRRY